MEKAAAEEAAPDRSFKVGERVMRRERGKEWKPGYVTQVDPLRVTYDIEDPKKNGFRWDEVRKMDEEDMRKMDVEDKPTLGQVAGAAAFGGALAFSGVLPCTAAAGAIIGAIAEVIIKK